MTDAAFGPSRDALARLEHLRARMTGLAEAVAILRASSPPRSSGTDPTSMVAVEVDRDGVPLTMRVEHRWQHHLRPEDLGDAVMAAHTAAVASGMQQMAQALESSTWKQHVPRLQQQPRPTADRGVSPLGIEGFPPRDIGVLTDEIVTALRQARSRGDQPGPTGTGHAHRGMVTITLSPGRLDTCVVNRRWVGAQTPQNLNAALDRALREARDQLRQAVRRQNPTTQPALDDALATLGHLTRGVGQPRK